MKVKYQFSNVKSRKGFTLVELLLTIGLIAVIAGFSIPFYSNFVVRNYLDTQTTTLVQVIQKAQFYTISGKENSAWGVRLNNSEFILFKGSSYATRDTGFDEEYSLPGTISPSGISEVVFAGNRGETGNSGTITLTGNTGEAVSIQIDSTGIVALN